MDEDDVPRIFWFGHALEMYGKRLEDPKGLAVGRRIGVDPYEVFVASRSGHCIFVFLVQFSCETSCFDRIIPRVEEPSCICAGPTMPGVLDSPDAVAVTPQYLLVLEHPDSGDRLTVLSRSGDEPLQRIHFGSHSLGHTGMGIAVSEQCVLVATA